MIDKIDTGDPNKPAIGMIVVTMDGCGFCEGLKNKVKGH